MEKDLGEIFTTTLNLSRLFKRERFNTLRLTISRPERTADKLFLTCYQLLLKVGALLH